MPTIKSRVPYCVWAMAWFFACVLSPRTSEAATIVLDAAQSDLRVEGPIEAGDAERFRREFRGKIRLVLNSPGGSMDETLKIIELMEKHAPDNEVVGTYLPRNSICFSACAFIFMHGGGVRAMDYTASLGFHAPWLPKTSPDDRSYTWSDLAGAFTEGQRVIRQLAQYNRMSLDLFVELLGKGPNELYMIDTPYRATKLGINLSGYFDDAVYSKVGWSEQEVDATSAVYPSKEAALWLLLRLMAEEHPFKNVQDHLKLDLAWLSFFSDPRPPLVLQAPAVHHDQPPPEFENAQTFEEVFPSENEWTTWLSNIKVQFSKKGIQSGRPELTYAVPSLFGGKTVVATFTGARGLFVSVLDPTGNKTELDDQEVAYEYAFPPGLILRDIPAWLRRQAQKPLVQ